jgi:guanyl-specific ribonuclease Sa
MLPQYDPSGKPISYTEYDVRPYIKGVNRGLDRLVIGGGRAFFTDDHYYTFIEIQ